jgi:hypothetical protein
MRHLGAFGSTFEVNGAMALLLIFLGVSVVRLPPAFLKFRK